jgi:superoxide dismutase, Cu-Zn family
MIAKARVAAALLSVSLCSSLAYGLATRHGAWDGVLVGKSGSKIKGEIGMTGGAMPGITVVDVKFSGDVAGVVRPWHVHVGSCAKGGAVFGDPKAYTPLRVNAKGVAEGKATLRVSLPDSGYYYMNVHESAANMGKIIACGDLLLEE